jgi:acyl-CoA thioesterase
MLSFMTRPSVIEAASTEFDRTTQPHATDRPGEFDVELSELWASLVGVHGGSLRAIVARCAALVEPDRRVRTLTTSFLRSARPGPATVHVREVRRGRAVTTLAAEIEQAGRTITTSRLTLMTPSEGIDWSTSAPIDLPPPEACVPITPPTPVEHFRRAEGLLDPSSLPFTGGPRTAVRGYVRPTEDRPIDAAWLAMISDWFPPPAFVRVEPPAGGISVDLTTHVHRTLLHLGAGWLAASFEIETSTGGLATEHGLIATTDGTVLAESFQTRWTAHG